MSWLLPKNCPKTIIHIYIYNIYIIYIIYYIYTPGTCLSSILGFEPSKRRPFPFKTRVIWVPGIYIYIHMKPPAKKYSSPNCFGSLLQGFGGRQIHGWNHHLLGGMILVGGCRWLITIINKSPSWGYSLSKWPFHGADKMGWSSNQYFPGKQVASNSHQFEISENIYIYIYYIYIHYDTTRQNSQGRNFSHPLQNLRSTHTSGRPWCPSDVGFPPHKASENWPKNHGFDGTRSL